MVSLPQDCQRYLDGRHVNKLCVVETINRQGGLPDSTDTRNLLRKAIEERDACVVRALLQTSSIADVNAYLPSDVNTPLHVASRQAVRDMLRQVWQGSIPIEKSVAVLKEVLQAPGVRVDVRNTSGATPLQMVLPLLVSANLGKDAWAGVLFRLLNRRGSGCPREVARLF